MNIRTVRRTSVALPAPDEPGSYLSNVSTLENARGRVAEFQYSDADLRDLDLADTHLLNGRISGLTVRRTRLDRVRVDSVEFTGSDLGALRWTDSKLSRVVFRDCKLMGSVFDGITLDNALFEHCKLDYGTFVRVRASGPVIFSSCSFREATFEAADLGRALLDDCDLRLTEFTGGTYRGLDLRGNDLHQVRGVASLRQVVLERSQAPQLAEALMAELGVTFGDDHPAG
ncbi:pentapeptide repeat-containing protein [Streptomyces sp. JNUCC 64]